MKIIILALISLFSFNTAAENLCQKNIDQIVADYEKHSDKSLISYDIKDCSSLVDRMKPVFGFAGAKNKNKKKLKVSASNACAVVLKFEGNGIPELVVYDDLNNFTLERDYSNVENESFSPSIHGNDQTGVIMFVKGIGTKGKNENGFLKNHKYIIRANYDLENETMQMVKWRLYYFWNSYSHDYTVQCQQLSHKDL